MDLRTALANGHSSLSVSRPAKIRPAVAELRSVPAQSQPTEDDNRRFAYRRPTTAPAGIIVDAVSPPIPCTIRNLSSTGALIELRTSLGSWTHTADDLPAELTLLMHADGVSVECEVARRAGRNVGLRFTGPARPVPRRTTQSPKPVTQRAVAFGKKT